MSIKLLVCAAAAAKSKLRKLDGALAPRTSLRLKVTQIGTAMGFFFFGNASS